MCLAQGRARPGAPAKQSAGAATVEKRLPWRLAKLASKPWKAASGPLRVMFQDEARFGRIVDLCRRWCPKPLRPVCRAIVSCQYTYAYAAVSIGDGQLDSLMCRTSTASACNSSSMRSLGAMLENASCWSWTAQAGTAAAPCAGPRTCDR